eukprot:9036558-Pyramimonas_sp.AAC.1
MDSQSHHVTLTELEEVGERAECLPLTLRLATLPTGALKEVPGHKLALQMVREDRYWTVARLDTADADPNEETVSAVGISEVVSIGAGRVAPRRQEVAVTEIDELFEEMTCAHGDSAKAEAQPKAPKKSFKDDVDTDFLDMVAKR